MSTIKTTTLSTLDGTATVPVNTVVNGSAKAWVNFNGTGTVAIRASFNVSSITDNSVGNYTVNFSSPIADANYAASAAAGSPGSRDGGAFVPATAIPTTTALIVRCFGSNALDTSYDHTYVYVVVFR